MRQGGRRAVIGALAGLLLLPAVATGGWSVTRTISDLTPAGCPPTRCDSEAEVDATVDPEGRGIVAWSARFRVHAQTLPDRRRHDLGPGFDIATGVLPGGAAIVVWRNDNELRFSRRTAGGRFAHGRRLAPSGSREGDQSPVVLSRSGRSTAVIYESPFRSRDGEYVTRLREVTIGTSGRPGRPIELGRGGLFFASRTRSGDVICCRHVAADETSLTTGDRSAGSVLLVRRRPGDPFAEIPLALARNEGLESIAVNETGTIALGTVDVKDGGDAGTLGTPMLRTVTPDGVISPPKRAPAKVAHRAFGPLVDVDDIGQVSLLWQEKTEPEAFSRTAPLHAMVGDRTQTLDRAKVQSPTITGGVAVWIRNGRWATAQREHGRFGAIRPPAGAAAPYQRYTLSVAGRRALLAWSQADGRVRYSRLAR